jgi:hypothetical protein
MILYYPHLNPIKFYQPEPDDQYHSRHIDDFEFYDTIPEWQDRNEYYQPWEKTDLIKLQLQSDFGPHQINIIDENDHTVSSVSFQQVAQNEDNPDLYIYECEIDISALEGVYRFQLQSGIDEPLYLISNQQNICESHQHSVLLSYRNYKFHEGVVFETEYYPDLRVEGAIIFKSPASKDQSYDDQTLNQSLISSVPYRVFELIIGDSYGIPDYLIDIINRILSCSDVQIDARGYVKNEGARWEPNEEEGIPTRGWRLEMRESNNRSTRIYNNGEPENARIGIVINADSKGFGNDTGGTTYELTDLI